MLRLLIIPNGTSGILSLLMKRSVSIILSFSRRLVQGNFPMNFLLILSTKTSNYFLNKLTIWFINFLSKESLKVLKDLIKC
jgi:hypothetical protein